MHGKAWTIEEKLEMVLKGMRDGARISDICREYKISQTMYYKWRDKFIEGGRKGLERKNADSPELESAYRKIHELERIIGKLTVHNEILKKTEEIMSGHVR